VDNAVNSMTSLLEPILIVLLAVIVGSIVLAMFLPLIISSGGNSGSQATSLIIRALALGELRLRDWWRVALRELPSGLVLGSLLGVIGATGPENGARVAVTASPTSIIQATVDDAPMRRLDRDEATALSRHAPDFWAFRHRVVEFYDTPDPLELSASTWGWAVQTDDLEEQIGLHEVRLAKLPEGAGSRTEQLELLFRLAGLYRAKKAYDRSIRSLQLGKEIARQLNDIAWLAEIWGKLGLVYLDMDHPLQAVRACRKAVRLDPRKADLWSNLGHFYHVEERYSDAIIAYKRALQLDPQNPSVSSALEACYRWLGKNALAEEQKQLIHK